MKIDWMIACDYALIDIKKKISLIGVFTNITSSKFPLIFTQFFVVTQMTSDKRDQEIEYQTNIKSEMGELVSSTTNSKMKVLSNQHTNISIFNMVKFPKPGKYIIEEIIDGENIGGITIEVSEKE